MRLLCVLTKLEDDFEAFSFKGENKANKFEEHFESLTHSLLENMWIYLFILLIRSFNYI